MLQSILLYNMKVIICSAVLLLYYSIALRNKRFHDYNRFYLLVTVLVSTIMPLLHLEWFTWTSTSSQQISVFNVITAAGGEQTDFTSDTFFNWKFLFVCAFLSTSFILLVMLLINVMKIFRLKKKFAVTNMPAFDFVVTDLQQAPFSFFKNIFWRRDINLSEGVGRQILNHEIEHVRQRHSWDKLFVECILCFYWVNPLFWFLKKELNLVHEFMADEKAVVNSDTSAFAKMLLATTFKKFDFLPAQAFFYSPIKRRLLMLTNSKKPAFSYLRRLMLLPLIAVVICLFAFKINEGPRASPKMVATKPFALVVDAGHGGKDLGTVGNGLNEKDIALKIAEKIKSLSPEYGIDVILTRNSDEFMAPPEKSDFANAQHADAFVSIHVNAAAEPSQLDQSGFEVLLSRNDARASSSLLLGSAIIQSLQPDFKVTPSLLQKKVGVWILDNSILPAALVECGYITNKNDANLLKDDSKIELIARAILNGAALFANNKSSISPQTIIHPDTDTSRPVQNATASALYVLDGKIVTKKEADKIDPSSIQQIDVLKGKDATDKYGDKGKNGVVEITLKKN